MHANMCSLCLQNGASSRRGTSAPHVQLTVASAWRRAVTAPVLDDAPVPPQNLEAEESVLGAMMLSPGAIGAVERDPRTTGATSTARATRRSTARRSALYAKGEPVDAITLADELDERSELEDVGGRFRIHELASLVPATANAAPLRADRPRDGDAARADPRRRRDRAARLGPPGRDDRPRRPRRADRLRPLAAARPRRVQPHRGAAEGELRADHRSSTSRAPTSPASRPASATSTASRPASRTGNLSSSRRGRAWGSRRSALCIAANLAVRKRVPVALFTLEMSKSEVTQRLMCSEAKVESQRLRTGKLAADDWPRLTAACDTLRRRRSTSTTPARSR